MDIEVTNQCSLIGFRALTDAGNAFLTEDCQTESWQWIGPVLYVDHRMAEGLIMAMEDNGIAWE